MPYQKLPLVKTLRVFIYLFCRWYVCFSFVSRAVSFSLQLYLYVIYKTHVIVIVATEDKPSTHFIPAHMFRSFHLSFGPTKIFSSFFSFFFHLLAGPASACGHILSLCIELEIIWFITFSIRQRDRNIWLTQAIFTRTHRTNLCLNDAVVVTTTYDGNTVQPSIPQTFLRVDIDSQKTRIMFLSIGRLCLSNGSTSNGRRQCMCV